MLTKSIVKVVSFSLLEVVFDLVLAAKMWNLVGYIALAFSDYIIFYF